MGIEKMTCCGALTAVYRDAGNRRHNPGCVYNVGPCPCECNSGGFCGGCGHAGCGGR